MSQDQLEEQMENIMPSTTKPVMVIGAGIAGIQAALDLANAGVPVVLVERKGSIGGTMAALDKTFPTLDCSICIEAPLMSDVMNNPNIEVKTMTEVKKVEGEAGNFNVTLYEKQRYVTDACTRCDLCSQACPQMTINEFDEGLAERAAVYTPFAQAEPGAYMVDIDLCLNDPPNNMPCTRCIDACLPNAISFNVFRDDTYVENVAAVITSTGFDMLDPSIIEEYGYGKHPDILTSMEFERLVNAAGPTAGHVMRPSNKEDPKSALFVLCVGSRDQRYCAYCSRVCCMYSIKEAHQAYDHGIKDVTVL
jgi:heterodisulfide reductase subunit A